jgi:hypothetical protein
MLKYFKGTAQSIGLPPDIISGAVARIEAGRGQWT